MKLEYLKKTQLNEGLQELKNDIKEIISYLRDVKKDFPDKNKRDIDRVIDKLMVVRDEMPSSDIAYLGKLLKKVLSMPLGLIGL